MIKTLLIKNFQSHEKSELNFSKGVNVIVGSTDSGKSAIKRALRLLMFNQPGGKAFRSNWAGDDAPTVVKMWDFNGHHASRSIEEGKNYYELDSHLYKAFGREVPEDLQKYFNVSEEINFQHQLDPPFLLTQTSGNVAKHFNKIAKLDKIDSATSKIHSAISNIQSTIKTKESNLTSYQEDLKKFPDLETLEVKLSRIEEKEERCRVLRNHITTIDILLTRSRYVKRKIKDLESFIENEEKVDAIISLIDKKKKLTTTIKEIQSDISEIKTIENSIKEIDKVLQFEIPVTNLLEKIATRNEKRGQLATITSLYKGLHNSKQKWLKMKEKVEQLETQFQDEMGDVCILCGSTLKHKH